MPKTVPRPIAFVVMPFRKRRISEPIKGAPKEVDFDALWDKAFRPAIENLGFLAVRADIETGSVIIKDMLERLAFSDLVIADITLPNGNVYYEIGIRHVAQKTSCVLIAAQWSKQLFDVDQMRSLRYPLIDGSVPEEEASIICRHLMEHLPRMIDAVTPYHELVSSKASSSAFREEIECIRTFQTEVRAARMERNPEIRKNMVSQLIKTYSGQSLELPEVALELMTLVRDNISWQEMIKFFKKLPHKIQKQPFFHEKILLAQSKLGNHLGAITALDELIKLEGETPERRGLIGGRYKRLWQEAKNDRKKNGKKTPDLTEQGFLESAIENYRCGMKIDLNEYYCASNLPSLLRERGSAGDEEEAEFFDLFIKLATQRKIDRNEDDGWARSTMLGTAFRIGDVNEVARLSREVALEGPAAWQLQTTLHDIEHAINLLPESNLKQELKTYFDMLGSLL